MTQKTLSVTAILTALAWVVILFRGLPSTTYDPDGEVLVVVLVALDLIILLLGVVAAIGSFLKKVSPWITIAVLAIPALHYCGSISESPFNIFCFIAPIAVLPITVITKWKSNQGMDFTGKTPVE